MAPPAPRLEACPWPLGAVSSGDVGVCAVRRLLRETPASWVPSGSGGGGGRAGPCRVPSQAWELRGSREGGSSSLTPRSSMQAVARECVHVPPHPLSSAYPGGWLCRLSGADSWLPTFQNRPEERLGSPGSRSCRPSPKPAPLLPPHNSPQWIPFCSQ